MRSINNLNWRDSAPQFFLKMKSILLFFISVLIYTHVFAQDNTHLCNIDGFHHSAKERGVANVTRHKMTPAVLAFNATGNVKFEAFIEGSPTPTRVTLTVGTSNFDYVNNGTNGDAVAGDNIYTLLYPASAYLAALLPDDAGRPFLGFLDLFEGTTRVLRGNILGQVRTADMPNAEIRSHSATQQSTNYIFNTVADNSNTNNLSAYARQFYQLYPDNFDFLNFVLVPGFFGNRFHAGIRNDVTGIGLSMMNNTSSWGSAGYAKGLNVFPVSTFYDGISTGYIHEMGHQWINFTTGTPLAPGIPHWPMSNLATNAVMGFSIGGPGGAGGTFSYSLTQQTGGYQFTAVAANSFPTFTAWELYLMGLIPKTQVTQTAVVFKNQASVPATGFRPDSDFNFATINDIVSILGERNPSSANSQKAFRAATIVVSDALLSADELAYYDFMTRRAESRTTAPTREGLAKGIGQSFFTATGGLATLTTQIFTPPVSTTSVEQDNNIKIVQQAEGVISIETDDLIERVLVTTIAGQTTISTSSNTLNISQLPTGTYIVSVKTNRGIKTQKVFKY